MPELFIVDQADLFERFEPVIHVLVNLILGEAVALLQLAFQLIAATLDHVEIIIGEFAPLLLGLAFDLLPVAFNPVPIHRYPPWRERDSNGLIIQTFREPIGKVQAGFCAGSHTAFGPAPSLRWTSS